MTKGTSLWMISSSRRPRQTPVTSIPLTRSRPRVQHGPRQQTRHPSRTATSRRTIVTGTWTRSSTALSCSFSSEPAATSTTAGTVPSTTTPTMRTVMTASQQSLIKGLFLSFLPLDKCGVWQGRTGGDHIQQCDHCRGESLLQLLL